MSMALELFNEELKLSIYELSIFIIKDPRNKVCAKGSQANSKRNFPDCDTFDGDKISPHARVS